MQSERRKLDFAAVNDAVKLFICDRQRFKGRSDLCGAGRGDGIVGHDQSAVVRIEAERILDRRLGRVEVDRAESRVFLRDGFLAVRDDTALQDREHRLRIHDIAFVGIIFVGQRQDSVRVCLGTVQGADTAVLISGGIQCRIYCEGFADVEFSCLALAVQSVNGDGCLGCGLGRRIGRSNSRGRIRRSNSRGRIRRSNSRGRVRRGDSRGRIRRGDGRGRIRRGDGRRRIRRGNSRRGICRSDSRGRVRRGNGCGRVGRCNGRGRFCSRRQRLLEGCVNSQCNTGSGRTVLHQFC